MTGDRPDNLPPELGVEPDDIVEDHGVVDEAIERFSGWDGVGTRREARERTLALLYEAEQRGLEPNAEVLEGLPVRPEPFTCELVEGVSRHLAEIDAVISAESHRWPLDRMPAIDRALLRLGVYELCWTDVPTGAVISEAIELAKRYSTDESHRFVNGLLSTVAERRLA